MSHYEEKDSQLFLGTSVPTQSQLIGPDGSKHQADFKPSDKQEKRVDQSVNRGEVEIVLRSLGMCCNSYETKVPARLDADDLFNLFEEENPNLEEVKEAFDVFDSNRDGFIDAEELQKVLCALGLKEGSEMENCRRMIGMFDENGDGRIDFDEFVKFMEVWLHLALRNDAANAVERASKEEFLGYENPGV
ncbi:UNVERIFIED_CONTAM: putative calcium-binding protein CML46 [Sesamum calycinum]|uniref:Calcium-binding protein CML46 n=1 Tax=Sesamum calycinum TaxID=2727403 RepID=A0AAW2STB4_9LAMI